MPTFQSTLASLVARLGNLPTAHRGAVRLVLPLAPDSVIANDMPTLMKTRRPTLAAAKGHECDFLWS
ncbi:hypothetical protein ANO14919_114000 [Xylariales sp. No.14919]|nr:hypothetical protein ANO14919_114000 [Xylariales sp. No.14919]